LSAAMLDCRMGSVGCVLSPWILSDFNGSFGVS
jgi:hypothetical protein